MFTESTARKVLPLRSKRPRRRVTAAQRLDRPELPGIDQCWTMDFVADNLFNGGQIRALTVVGNFSRECTLIRVERSIKGENVTLDFYRSGKPTDKSFIESFNSSSRDECLNSHWFLSLEDAREKIGHWVI